MMKPKQKGSQSGIALFMVMSALALMSILTAELTYTTQMNSRLASNYVDNLKAFYLAKAGFKLSLVRLNGYLKAKNYVKSLGDAAKGAIPAGTLEKIWDIPFIYPMVVPKSATIIETDAITDFLKASKLSGTFTAAITTESTKLNLNNLLVQNLPAPAPTTSAAPNGAAPPAPVPTPTSTVPMKFRELLEPTIDNLLNAKKTDDREFADVYRNVFAKDIVDAIMVYLKPDQPSSNLPGFKQITAKSAPFYSLSELHMVPGLDDDLYNLLEPTLTVFSTPGISMNSIQKPMLRALLTDLTDEDATNLLRKRDDPENGVPWTSADDFWKAVGETSAGRHIDEIKKRLTDAGITLVFDGESSFKISVLANVGLSTRRLEAFVLTDLKAASTPAQPSGLPPGSTPITPPPRPGTNQPGGSQDGSSEKKKQAVQLIYWRML